MTSAWWTSRSIMAAATTSSLNTSPHRTEGLVGGDDQAGTLIPGRYQLEEQVGGLGLERDVSHFVDYHERVAAQPGQLGLQPPAVVSLGQPGDPPGGGGEGDPVPGLAGADRQPDRQVGLAGAGRAEEDHVVFAGDEVQGAQVRDHLPPQPAGVVEVELLQALPGGRRAARMRPSPPWASRADTSRCRQAARSSSWLHDSDLARPASLVTDSRSAGAFSALVKNASSAVTSRPAARAAAITPPS